MIGRSNVLIFSFVSLNAVMRAPNPLVVGFTVCINDADVVH
jgi:hypothetical protein